MAIITKLEALLACGGIRRDVLFLVISACFLFLSFCGLKPYPFDFAWIAIILCGLPIIAEAFVALVTAFDIKADLLVSLALIASVIIGEDFAAGEVAFIMQIGALLEKITVAKAQAGIEKLVRMTPQTARRLRDGGEEVIPAAEVLVDDLLRVLPGETVPVDGTIIRGQTSLNEAVLTGESLPVDKGVGDSVASGTINQFGAFDMQATRVGEDSSLQRMVRLVQSADASKAKIVRLADRWATWIVLIALTSAAITWMVTGEVIRAVTILVVFCPCALVLATPTAIMAAIGNATRHGFLVRVGDALERLACVTRLAFDKTGTLTLGVPCVIAVEAARGFSSETLFRLTAAAESCSEHPLGKAVVASYKEKNKPLSERVENFQMLGGLGIKAMVDGQQVCAGNRTFLQDLGCKLPVAFCEKANSYRDQGASIIFCVVDGQFVGFLALADTLRSAAPEMIARLEGLKVTPVLLTGDDSRAATHIAQAVGISSVQAQCLPEQKLAYIEHCQDQGQLVCMIGDGINDAPALKKAHVGIAMGGVGSDIAVDAADIALVRDEIQEIPHLLALAKRTMLTITCNLFFSLFLNFVAILFAMSGMLNPVMGALVHNAGSVFVIIHSALLLQFQRPGITFSTRDSVREKRKIAMSCEVFR